MSRIFLVGFMGSGKSSVGRRLARRLSMPFVDTDAEIEAAESRRVAEIFSADGEERFRALESEALRTAASGPDAVVACGGGAVLSPENRQVLESAGRVVYLRVGAEEALSRMRDTVSRPLLAGDAHAAAERLLSSREHLYEQVADVTVDTAGRTVAEVAEAVADALGATAARGGAA